MGAPVRPPRRLLVAHSRRSRRPSGRSRGWGTARKPDPLRVPPIITRHAGYEHGASRRDEVCPPALLYDGLRRLSALVELPVQRGVLVGRVQDRLFEEPLAHLVCVSRATVIGCLSTIRAPAAGRQGKAHSGGGAYAGGGVPIAFGPAASEQHSYSCPDMAVAERKRRTAFTFRPGELVHFRRFGQQCRETGVRPPISG